MLTLTRRQSREVDRLAIDRFGFSGLVLMENAGRGVADKLGEWRTDERITICCGKGNNGGDGIVVARHLQSRGIPAEILLWANPDEVGGDAGANLHIAERAGIAIHPCLEAGEPPLRDGWIVDGLLGTGFSGEPRGAIRGAIAWINRCPGHVLALDVPSGMDCDSGATTEHTVRADRTCTFVAAKIGFQAPGAADYTGTVHVVGIGIPPNLLDELLK